MSLAPHRPCPWPDPTLPWDDLQDPPTFLTHKPYLMWPHACTLNLPDSNPFLLPTHRLTHNPSLSSILDQAPLIRTSFLAMTHAPDRCQTHLIHRSLLQTVSIRGRQDPRPALEVSPVWRDRAQPSESRPL